LYGRSTVSRALLLLAPQRATLCGFLDSSGERPPLKEFDYSDVPFAGWSAVGEAQLESSVSASAVDFAAIHRDSRRTVFDVSSR
jgi:hypothetical protein